MSWCGEQTSFFLSFSFSGNKGGKEGFLETYFVEVYLITEMSNKYDINELEGII